MHVDACSALMPTEETLAQVLAEPHMPHEACSLRGHVSCRGDHYDALGMPAFSLCECHRSAPQGMTDCKCRIAVATPNHKSCVDEVGQRAQITAAETVPWLVKRNYG
jgi:hypothetical protein